ncbi:MAG: thiamine-phosphate synthase family protein [Halodesulfurarchaeum sp.]|nr:thiamine-phosphate synthase family protein [Halodesulfurarchaeum sp.]
MKFRAEVIAESVLPTIRAMLASELRERGLTQHEVAEKLGLSQSAVSKYAQGEIATSDAVARDERVQELVADLTPGLATGDVRPVQALIEIERLLGTLSGPGDLVAELHEEAVPELRTVEYDLDSFEPDQGALERERARASVRRGLRILEHATRFAGLVPHVGSNLVEVLESASALEDVVGVPGRILDVNGRVEVPGEPEFGVSEYVGGVLLAARGAGSEAKAGLNLAFTPETLDALLERETTVVELHIENQSLEAAVSEAIAATPQTTVLYHRGAVGVEPIVYLLGPTAVEVARKARDVAKARFPG